MGRIRAYEQAVLRVQSKTDRSEARIRTGGVVRIIEDVCNRRHASGFSGWRSVVEGDRGDFVASWVTTIPLDLLVL